MKNYYTTFEAAQICHVSQGSMIRWIHEGKIPASVTPGGHHRIEVRNLTRFLQQLRMPVPKALGDPAYRLLIVTENPSFSLTLKRWVADVYPGVQIEEAKESFTAGWKVSRFSPDIVILDLGKVAEEGLKICSFVRALPECGRIPFLILGPSLPGPLQKRINQMGLCAWLEKPFDKYRLKEMLERLFVSLPFKNTGS